MFKWLKGFPVGEIKDQKCSDGSSIMAYDNRPISFTSACVPYLSGYRYLLLQIFVKHLDGLSLKLYADRWNLASKDSTIIALQDIWFSYSDVAWKYNYIDKKIHTVNEKVGIKNTYVCSRCYFSIVTSEVFLMSVAIFFAACNSFFYLLF